MLRNVVMSTGMMPVNAPVWPPAGMPMPGAPVQPVAAAAAAGAAAKPVVTQPVPVSSEFEYFCTLSGCSYMVTQCSHIYHQHSLPFTVNHYVLLV